MKRTVFRISILGIVVALGLLAIAHAQRTGTEAPPDDGSPNPLRNGQPQPAVSDATGNYRTEVVGPVDTDVPPRDNPLRNRPAKNSGSVQRLSAEDPQGQAPMRIQLVANGEPAGGNGGNTNSTIRAAGEPQYMPATADRYAVPAQPLFSGAANSGPRLNSPDPRNTYLPGSTRNAVPEDAAGTSVENGTGQPGSQQLEGPQSPQVVVQKIAPAEIQVGRPAVLRVVVRNTGTVAASEVEIHDQVPRGTHLLGTTPPASQGARGELVWSLGTLKPGAGTTVEMQIMPAEEGEVGSIATVRFQADATARSKVTRPKLVVETSGANRVLVGDDTTLTFTVSNPGSGVATGVVLAEHIPAGLKHPGGSELEYTVGDLKPGESRQLRLPLKAAKPGTIANLVTARADANLRAEHRFNLEVTSPQLDVALAGPKRRYLEREATYQLSVSNPGTAPAQQVELVAYLPQGLKFVNANNAGRYDEGTRAVYWRLEELPVNQHGTVELVTMPVEPGQFSIKVHGAAQRGLAVEKEQPVLVEGLAAVLFQLSHTRDPVEIGGETTYEITVANQGSKASSNVQMSILFPGELKPLAAEGPTRYTIDIENNKVVFETLPQLAPKSVAAFRVRARGVRAGDLRVRCQLMTDELQRPIVKEESTRVYADE
ncbi:MAG: hypothetical protein ABSG53_07275 [Thermoguttaceae bacterium]|jgi:uncharacterized repeat protein (TIGR01451 family)